MAAAAHAPLQSKPSTRIPAESYPPPFSLAKWVAENRHLLRPPVGNKMVYPSADCQFKVMVVGGPNSRTDYHVDPGEEWFYQLEGDMVLKIVDGGEFKDVVIRQGECYLHPAKVPHSPQRMADTVGLVIERVRAPHERDGLRWYCPQCRGLVYEETFHCVDLGSQLKPVIERYYGNAALRTCKRCGTVDEPPASGKRPAENAAVRRQPVAAGEASLPAVNPETHPPPFSLQQWIERHKHELAPPVGNKMVTHSACQFKVMVVGGPNQRTDYHQEEGEEWFYQLKGDMVLKVVDGGEFKDVHIREGETFLLPANVPHSPQRSAGSVGLVMERERAADEVDSLRWFCARCRSVVHLAAFHCQDLGTQLRPVIQQYYGSEALRKCPTCGAIDVPPEPRKG
jgi:3-hydroxyanthranilate 3,4-dioxygenase